MYKKVDKKVISEGFQCIVSLAVKMHYDQTFKSEFGNESLNVMRRVLAQAQNIYYWPTLPSIVTLNVVAEEEITDYITADGPSL